MCQIKHIALLAGMIHVNKRLTETSFICNAQTQIPAKYYSNNTLDTKPETQTSGIVCTTQQVLKMKGGLGLADSNLCWDTF